MSDFKTIEAHPQMGLDNKICENPKAFCGLKRVWLNEQQVNKCLNKLDTNMIDYKKCKYLKLK